MSHISYKSDWNESNEKIFYLISHQNDSMYMRKNLVMEMGHFVFG